MNRLELASVVSSSTQLSRCVGFVLIASLIATTQATAQFSPTPITSPQAGLPVSGSALTIEQVQSALQQIQASLANHDYKDAVQTYRSLGSPSSLPATLQPQIMAVRQQLVSTGIDAALLDLPVAHPAGQTGESNVGLSASGPVRLNPISNVVGAQPIASAAPHPLAQADVATRKREALRLLAIGRAALDRGDISMALQNARSAKSLNVPEKEFAAGEPRVWSLLLDSESAAKRSGLATLSDRAPSVPATPGIQPAYGTAQANALAQPGGEQNAIAQMLFTGDPNAGLADAPANPNQPPTIQQVQNVEPNQNYGTRALELGLQALSSGDRLEARKQFLEAWRFKSELTVTQQSQLKDKLTLMQPKRLVPEGKKSANELSPIDKAQLESESKTRRLYSEVTSELANVEKYKSDRPLDALDELERLRRRIDGSDVDAAAKRSLNQIVSRTISSRKTYIDANRAKIDLDIRNDSIKASMEREDQQQAQIDSEVSQLVEEFNQLMNDRRFSEAEIIAKQVGELKPDDPISITMFHNARMGVRLEMNKEIDAAQENHFARMMLDVERSSVGQDPDNPISLPDAEVWNNLSNIRLNSRQDQNSNYSPAEQRILSQLSSQVSVNFNSRPLGEVMMDLSAMTGVPIIIDERAISTVRVTTESPVKLQLAEAIAMKSALNLMLKQLDLAYVVDNDVLTITTREAKEANVETRTYRVTDLVTPIPNFVSSYEDGLAGALRAAYQATQPQADVQLVPVSPAGIDRRIWII